MFRFIPALIWLIFITVLFLIPGSQLPKERWFEKIYLDKWVHTAFFFLLVCLFFFPQRKKTRKNLLSWVLAAIVYGIIIELIQRYWTADRSFDFIDIVFDGLGCLAAYFVGTKQVKK